MTELGAPRIGLVGCGVHGTNLAQAAVRTESLDLVACADPDESAARRAAAFGSDVSIHDSVESLLASTRVDAVLIATPHHLLAPTALAAIQAGKHVLVEKPMAMNAREGAEVELAAARAGVTCMAGYSFRFSMGSYVQTLLAAGAVGDIQAVSGSIGVGPMNRSWTARPETGGGPLLYVGCHLIDFLLWFTGDEPVSVFADVRQRSDSGTDETSAIQIGLAKGCLGQLLVTQAAPGFFYDFHIQGRSGSIALRGRNFLQFEIEVFSTSIASYAEPTVIRPAIRRDNISMMLVPELEEFASSVRERRRPWITAADGCRVLKVLDAVVESGNSRERVALEIVVYLLHRSAAAKLKGAFISMTMVETGRRTMTEYLDMLVARGNYRKCFSHNVTLHLMGTDQKASGPEAVEGIIRYLHEQAFDAQPELKTLVVDGERAAIEADFAGRHVGEFSGKPASGKDVRVPYSVHYDLEGDRIKALRIYMPVDMLLQQIES